MNLRLALLVASTLTSIDAASAWPDCSVAADGHLPFNGTNGTHGPATLHVVRWQGRPLYVLVPTGHVAFPLLVFMHGLAGQYEMYRDNLLQICTHGFVVIFPFIKSPEADKSPLTSNSECPCLRPN